jgi:hypothetical protein
MFAYVMRISGGDPNFPRLSLNLLELSPNFLNYGPRGPLTVPI